MPYGNVVLAKALLIVAVRAHRTRLQPTPTHVPLWYTAHIVTDSAHRNRELVIDGGCVH